MLVLGPAGDEYNTPLQPSITKLEKYVQNVIRPLGFRTPFGGLNWRLGRGIKRKFKPSFCQSDLGRMSEALTRGGNRSLSSFVIGQIRLALLKRPAGEPLLLPVS